jgi:virginiamycin B lyase
MSDPVSTLSRIDPRRNVVVARIKIESRHPCPAFPRSCGEAAAGGGAVWVTHPSDNTVSRIKPKSNGVTATIPVGPQPTPIAVSPGAVWVVNIGGPSVSRIDPSTNRVVATIRLGPARACCSEHMSAAFGAGALWVAVPNLYAVVRVDIATNRVTATIPVADQPCGGIAADERAVWAAGDHCASSVTRVDSHTNKPTGTVKGEIGPIGLALGFGSVWVEDLDAK